MRGPEQARPAGPGGGLPGGPCPGSDIPGGPGPGGQAPEERFGLASRRARPAPPPPEALPEPVVDAHCHLDLVEVPLEAVLAAAAAAGVARVVTIGIDAATSRWQAELAATHPRVRAAVAIHPNEVAAAAEGDLDEIARLARLPQVRAVGETGLDHFRTGQPGWAAQEASLRAHAEIAAGVGKPLVIHDRDAHWDVLRVLDSSPRPPVVVFHCFSGDVVFATECLRRGHVLSFAGNLTFANAAGLRAAAREVPAGQLLVETDAPFLTPVPHRGAPNEPAQLARTVRALAELRGEELPALCRSLSATAEAVFGPW